MKEEMDAHIQLESDFVHFARLAITGRAQDVQTYIRRMTKRYQASIPSLAEALGGLLSDSPIRSSPLRRDATPVPVDTDSRLSLLRCEELPYLDVEPVFREDVARSLRQLVEERLNLERLSKAGLSPTKSVLFTGPPGVGKTLSAKWLAHELKLPLLTLDLSAVMSSFLGRTGSNVRHVLDYAKNERCILFLDEFDAVAKRRDDATEIGELKRLVTVLLQEIDDWPCDGLLLAATNHPDLLDPAVWRRFEMRIEFPMPSREEAYDAISQWLGRASNSVDPITDLLCSVFEGKSFSEIERSLKTSQRIAAVADEPVEKHLKRLIHETIVHTPRTARREIAVKLVSSGILSQREVHELTGVSRDTIRKHSK